MRAGAGTRWSTSSEIGVLGPNAMFAHMNILRDDEVDPILRSGMSISWNAPASMMWGVGGATHGRHAELYRAGVNVGLGSDSSNWANSFDIGRAAVTAILAARDGRRDRSILVAEDGLTMATINGARAIRMDQHIGSLEVGKRADLVIRTDDLPEAHPTTDRIAAIMYATGSKSVDTVVIDGHVVLEGWPARRSSMPWMSTAAPTRQQPQRWAGWAIARRGAGRTSPSSAGLQGSSRQPRRAPVADGAGGVAARRG